ncbi:MAG: ROK family protein [Ignavibacteria bacterium]|nr:ROK family protein [Ignavibacteria bacterium]
MAEKIKYALGIDLGGTSIKLGIVSNPGKIVSKISLPSHAELGPDEVISQVKKGIKQILAHKKEKIKGIGIGVPGVINTEKGTVEYPPNFPGWGRIKVGKIIQKEFGIKTLIENDANAAAIGELIFGAGKKYNSFIMITLGTGVGGGVIFNKKIYRGEFGAAGEIGHISINYKGPKCKCGSVGCVEAYIGNNYLKEHVIKDLQENPGSKILELVNNEADLITPRIIQEAMEMGDEFAKSVVENMGIQLGVVLTSVSNLLDISTFIIGGGVSGFGKPLFNKIQETIVERVFIPTKKRVKVLPAKLKNDSGIKGASALVFYKS